MHAHLASAATVRTPKKIMQRHKYIVLVLLSILKVVSDSLLLHCTL